MPHSIQRIALTAWSFAQRTPPDFARIAAWLREKGYEVVLDETAAQMAGEPDRIPRERAIEGTNLVIVFGGDGSMLRTAHNIVNDGPPLLGINTGHLGFLADVPLADLFPALERILLRGEFTVEPRMRLRPATTHDGQTSALTDVLNDVVLTTGPLARMVEFRISVNGHHMGDFRGDGLILATPTGSTAYSLSAGGPLLMPHMGVILINPICPHTLSNRPVVVPADSVIDVVVFPDTEAAGRHVLLTLDGYPGCELQPNDCVRVVQSPDPIRVVRPAGVDFFHTLRDKLHWETHPRGADRT